jgi:hypothetical protein
MYTLGQAAKATGRAKVTLARAVKSGKLSAARGPDGSYAIDPSELARVYPLTSEPASDMERSVPPNGPVNAPGTSPREVEALHQRIAEQTETIRDLRARLDDSEAERRRVQDRLTGLLAAPAQPPAPDPPRPLLGRRILAWLARQHGW